MDDTIMLIDRLGEDVDFLNRVPSRLNSDYLSRGPGCQGARSHHPGPSNSYAHDGLDQ